MTGIRLVDSILFAMGANSLNDSSEVAYTIFRLTALAGFV